MASRKEQKARAREERLARERAAAVAEKRRRRRNIVGWGVAALLVAAGIVVPFALGGGGSDKASAGLQSGPPPWPPETANLQKRLDALDFPQGQGEGFHFHPVVRVYNDGEPVQIPPNIGIDEGNGTMAPLHTHDPTGKIHVESPAPYDYTLGHLFEVWGVEFTPTRLGGLIASGEKTIQVFVNGEPVKDPADYVFKPRDKIVVAYGAPGQAPKTFRYEFQQGE